MADPPSRLRIPLRFARLSLVIWGALGLRVLAAILVEWYSRRKGTLCIFPDTRVYWLLAETIREGRTYEVVQWGTNPYYALRTPGYPLFLAACRLAFGDRVFPVRLVQALLGAVSVWLVDRLTAEVAPSRLVRGWRGWSVPLVAAALTALDPFVVGTTVLVLSEAVFIPLMLVSLWGLAVIWRESPLRDQSCRAGHRHRFWLWALGSGLASGGAILVRPSWLLFVPGMLLAWLAASLCLPRGRAGAGAGASLRGALLVTFGVVVVLAPWWVRNARIYGRFVPTALWTGASLYDGLNPRASGASDMDGFLAAPDIGPLGEEAQDAELFRRAVAFARAHPRRVLELAVRKAGRYWSPWPNAEGISARMPVIAVASAAYSVPLLAAIALGAWDRRRDGRALVLLGGPLVYFAALHMVFASSMRYRIPAMVPAMGLAALGLGRLLHSGQDAHESDPDPDPDAEPEPSATGA